MTCASSGCARWAQWVMHTGNSRKGKEKRKAKAGAMQFKKGDGLVIKLHLPDI